MQLRQFAVTPRVVTAAPRPIPMKRRRTSETFSSSYGGCMLNDWSRLTRTATVRAVSLSGPPQHAPLLCAVASGTSGPAGKRLTVTAASAPVAAVAANPPPPRRHVRTALLVVAAALVAPTPTLVAVVTGGATSLVAGGTLSVPAGPLILALAGGIPATGAALVRGVHRHGPARAQTGAEVEAGTSPGRLLLLGRGVIASVATVPRVLVKPKECE